MVLKKMGKESMGIFLFLFQMFLKNIKNCMFADTINVWRARKKLVIFYLSLKANLVKTWKKTTLNFVFLRASLIININWDILKLLLGI